MDLKVLFLLLIYYGLVSSIFLIGGDVFGDGSGFSTDIALNDSELSSGEIDTGGLFGSGISFGRFAGLVGLGVGLPDDTPTGFKLIFGLWQTMVTILSIGFFISSIWDG